jgi:putative transposase
MPQSFASVHLHLIFSTKHRQPFLTPPFAFRVYEYLGGTVRGSGCVPLAIGGMPDHVHLLVGMGREISIADLIKTIKAASSRWIHDTFPELGGFAWQAGYGAFSVSGNRIERVKGYIAGQAVHHRIRTFQEEYRDFLARHEIEWDERYVWD